MYHVIMIVRPPAARAKVSTADKVTSIETFDEISRNLAELLVLCFRRNILHIYSLLKYIVYVVQHVNRNVPEPGQCHV